MKVVHVIDTIDDSRNGAVISTQRFIRLLRKEGNEVRIVSTGKEEENKVSLREFYPFIGKKIMQQMKFAFARPDKKRMVEAFKGADIIHNQFPFYLGYRAIGIARELNIPVASTFHVQAEQIVYNAGLRKKFLVSFIYWLFVKFIYNRSDIVICPSPLAGEEIRKRGCRRPIVVISNGVSGEYRPLNGLSKEQETFTILTVGRNAAEKRQEMILRAVANSKHREKIRLVIVGEGPLRERLEKLNSDLLSNTAQFYYLPPEEIIPFYNKANLYVHASTVEVECMTALEAMACGLPLLVANAEFSAAKQFALNDKHLFTTQDELTQKIDYWFEQRNELYKAGLEYLTLADQYRLENSYALLKGAYANIIQGKKNGNQVRS